MRSQNRKVNNVGKVSCLGLLALMLALVNPVSSAGIAFAEEMPEEVSGPMDGDVEMGAGEVDGDIELYADTPSTVTVSFLPSNNVSGTVTPVNTSDGDKAKVDVKATVRVQNSGGYSVYVGSNSSDLKNGTNTIPSVTSATTYANLPLNRWGYSFQEGSTVKDSYVAMPATLRGTALYSNTNANITDETKTFMLSFAARIGSDKPSGTYSNSVTMSVVSSPLSVAEEIAYDFGGITDMQAMTTAICNAAPTGGVKQLKDTRDGKYYWIGKMKDGKCWMTQNLDLDLSTGTKLTPADSDVTTDYTPAYDTATVANSSTILNSVTGQRSWSLGNYSITNPTNATGCGYGLENAAACAGGGTVDRFKYYVTPTTADGDTNAHYILGNHYQWNTATAGTGGNITEGQAASSICPKGWKLPISGQDADGNNITTAGSFGGLTDAYNIGASVAKLVSAPLYFVRGGYVYRDASVLLDHAGYRGFYWSSTGSDPSNAYDLTFYTASNVNPSFTNNRAVGASVRCIAK